MKNRLLHIAACIGIGFASVAAHAAWPDDKPIEILVGFVPGGPSDILARTMAPFIAKHLGGQANLIIVNRPGAGGEIAVGQLSRSKADGYTVGIVNLPGYQFLPMYRKTAYDTKDLSLIARVVSDPQIMVARKDSKLTDLKQVVAALAAKPGAISVGNNGIGTSGHLGVIRLEKAANVTFNHIPYNGSAQQKSAIVGSQLDLAMLAASEVQDPEREAVPMRILAVFAKTPSAKLAAVPTTYAQGFPVELTSERGFAAPAGTPPAILQRMQAAIQAAMKDPEYIKLAKNDAPFLAFLGGSEWTEQMEADRKGFEEIAKTLPKQ